MAALWPWPASHRLIIAETTGQGTGDGGPEACLGSVPFCLFSGIY